MATMTVKGLAGEIKAAKATKTPTWMYDGGAKGAGQLIAKVSGTGARFYFDYKTSTGKRDRIPLGPYAEKTQDDCLTLEDARDKARELSKICRDVTKDVRLHLDQKRIDHERELERQKQEREKADAGSLCALMDAYVDHLKTAGKVSHKDVSSFFRVHVAEPFPALIALPANTLGKRDFTAIFDRMQAAGFGRALGKVRSALHAAYNMALKSEKAGREAFRIFHVDANPIAGIDTYKELSVPGERVLTVRELRTYLRGIDALGNPVMRLAMLLQIYLGGQRPAQLFRVTAADVDLDRDTITQYDGKGKRQHPRAHVLPLTPKTRAWVEELMALNNDGPGIFSTDGRSTVWPGTASGVAHEISGGAYRLGDIRRTVETEMGRLKIGKDIKAQLLSHGLGDIQTRHYDKFAYLDEKLDALTKWERYLDTIMAGDNVVPITG
jgi:integrase